MKHFNRGKKVLIYLLLFAFIFPTGYLPKTEASANGGPSLQSALSGNADGMLNGIVYANGKYTAVGDRGYIGQSLDGINWTRVAAPVSNEATSWRSIVFEKNMYVAVGLNTTSNATAKLMTSPDGENWTDRSSSIDGTILQKAVFLNNQFFAVGGRWSGNDRSLDVGIIYSSTDGLNWTLTAAPEKFWPVSSTTSTPFFLMDMAYISGRYVVGGNVFGSYAYSTNLSSWTKGFIDDYALDSFSVYNNKLYVTRNGSDAYSSSDGITFAPASDYTGMRGSLQDGSTLYRFGVGGNWFESADDGASWTPKTAITNLTILDAATNGSSFVLVTNGTKSLVVSPDKSSWSRFEGNIQGVAYNGSQWVGVATVPSRSGGEIDSFLLTSSSGWSNLSSVDDFLPKTEFYDVAYGNNAFIAIGKKIARSSDGVSWTLEDLPAGTAGKVTAITYGSSRGFVAVTNGGSILASPDGSNWTVDNSHSGTEFAHVKDVNGVYIATAPYDSFWVSDGSGGNWTKLDSLSDYYAVFYDLADVAYGEGTYAITGADENGNAVVLSATGNSLDEIATWNTHVIDSSVYATMKTIQYSDGYFVTGGLEYLSSPPDTYVLYATSDFTNWTNYNEQTTGISSTAINNISVQNVAFYIVGDNNVRIVMGVPSGPTTQPETTPAAIISFADEKLTGLTSNAAYLINGQNATADSDGKIAIDSAWLGETLSIVKVGNGTTTTNSTPQSLVIPNRPAAPSGVGKTDETYTGAKDGSLTGLPVGGEYKKGAAGAWSDISSATVSGLEPDTYYVRTKATSSAFVSEEAAVTVGSTSATAEATPSALISFVDEQLTGLVAIAAYLINGQNAAADSDGKIAIDSAWLGETLSIVKVGNGTTTTNSSAQSLVIPDRPVAPSGVGKTDETYTGAKDGSLTGLPVGGEYKKGAAGAWSDISNITVTGLEPDTYYVRIKATSSAFVSEEAAVTVGSTSATAEATPAALISFVDEQLTGLTANAAYLINGQNAAADSDGKIVIDSAWLGETLSIVKVGNGTTTTNSLAQSLVIPNRPAAPSGVGKTDETYTGAKDGSLTGLPVGGEYKKGAAGAWSDISSATVSGLEPDTYYVRTKATSSAFASEETATIIGTLPAAPGAPNVSADDVNDRITGLNTTMEYQIDGGSYVKYDGNNLPVLNGAHTVKVRVAASGSVPAGAEVTLYFTAPVAAGLTVTAVDPSGTANNGKTAIAAAPTPTTRGHKLVYKNLGSNEVIPPRVGDAATDYADLPDSGLVNAAHGEKIGVAEVDADGKIVKFGFTTAVVIQEQTSGGTTTTPPVVTGPSSTETDVIVIVNGISENAGKAKTTETNGLTTTTVIVDPQKLQAKLDSQGNGAIVTVPISSSSTIIRGELNGQSIQNMDNRSATLVLRTDHASYHIPAHEINIGQLAETLSPGTKLSDMSVNIIIAEPSDEMNQVVRNSADKGKFTVVVPSVDFKLTVSHEDKSVEITNFNVYVERKIALPDNVDPNKITTGIVVDPNGVTRHVPTKVVLEEGTHYAVINSLTNSTYSVVWHPLIFADMENHWAKGAVNDMGSRMIVNGVDSSTFNPNKDITRAEFAAMVVRGLGLRLGEGTNPFSDVKEQDWYLGAIQTAVSYNLIAGFEDGTFRPNAAITREQAMTIIARAMKLTGLAATTGTPNADEIFSAFEDSATASGWSKESIALTVKAGVVGGRSDGSLDAKANITRAEVAVLIQRLLKKSDLI
ncbi:S-layer homology domain-containing protein [Paenibacillus sp. CAU 1782]